MCYSAEASFIASGVLAGSSVAIARLPKKNSSLPLALVPAIFAAHQFAEGVTWLSMEEALPEEVVMAAVTFYVLIAYVLWPIYIPYAAYRTEPGKRRKKIIIAFQVIGFCTGAIFLYSILSEPVHYSIDCCHITYNISSPHLILAPYLLAVSIPFLVSSQRGLVLFGAAVTISCGAAAYLANAPGFPSLWCFFAAALSGGLYLHFRSAARDLQQLPESHEGVGAAAG